MDGLSKFTLQPRSAALVPEVIPDGAYEHYVERVLDSSRYWVLKIVGALGIS